MLSHTRVETTRGMVEEMLADIPQASSIELRFSALEAKMDQKSQHDCRINRSDSDAIQSTNLMEQSSYTLMSQSDLTRVNQGPCNSSYVDLYPDPITTVEIANELEERNKRKNSIVVHNLPEASNLEDAVNVSNILCEVLDSQTEVEFETDEYTSKSRIYRLGRKQPNKVRSLKIHLKSAGTRDKILENTRRLSSSERYNKIVIQKDMTPLERVQLKRLVYEKNRRNHVARKNHEDANWTIRGGIICQKTNY